MAILVEEDKKAADAAAKSLASPSSLGQGESSTTKSQELATKHSCYVSIGVGPVTTRILLVSLTSTLHKLYITSFVE